MTTKRHEVTGEGPKVIRLREGHGRRAVVGEFTDEPDQAAALDILRALI